ncbi:hypothetical protein ONV78_04245 [Hahella sp. CR1]|uniref:hypothetical protein n=1 Tax=Hahella sp. CR1 TaxID=2992807 RepID=UPI0024421E3B|nr:hypothetical protein [Hahella sp. CR1]MDG9666937.1 hypothetical protein [Hahella sp. CR1]
MYFKGNIIGLSIDDKPNEYRCDRLRKYYEALPFSLMKNSFSPKWKQGEPEQGGVYYVLAVQYPAGLVYDISFRQTDPGGDSYWVGFDSCAARTLAWMPVAEAIALLTGVLDPSEKVESPGAIIQWRYGEPDRNISSLAALRYMYDVIRWDNDYGWSVPLSHCDAHIPLRDFLVAVSKHIPYNLADSNHSATMKTVFLPDELIAQLKAIAESDNYPEVTRILNKPSPSDMETADTMTAISLTREEAQALANVAIVERMKAELKYPYWSDDHPKYDEAHENEFFEIQAGLFGKLIHYLNEFDIKTR